MSSLILRDDNESINFIYDAYSNTCFRLQDKTFKMSTPEKVELRVADNYFSGKNLLRQEYGPRQVTFDARVMGITQLQLSQNISKIQRLLSRASSMTYLQGGAYNQDVTMTEGSDTGDQGVILQIRRGADTLGNVTSELTNSSVSQSGLYTLRIIQGDLVVDEDIFSSADSTSNDIGTVITTLASSINNSQTTMDVASRVLQAGINAYISSTGEEVSVTNNGTNVSGNWRYTIVRGANGTTPTAASSSASVLSITGRYSRNCTITLSCEPFILGMSRVIAQDSSTPGYKGAPAIGGSNVNRVFISAASVPGDVEALTRIGTQISGGTGLIVARDAGISILNCPSAPGTASSSGLNDAYVFGQVLSTSNLSFRLRVNTGPTRFSFSDNGGSSYGSSTNITTPWTPYQLIAAGPTAYNAYVMFGTTSGFVDGQSQLFVSHQAYLGGDSTINCFSNRVALMSDVGLGFASFDVNIPPGCRSRYKVIAQIDSDITNEYLLKVSFYLRSGIGTKTATTAQFYEWTGPYPANIRLLDLGIIDLGSMSVPFMSQPYAMSQMQITVFARTSDEILSDVSKEMTCTDLYLVPCQDEYSYMQAGWKSDGSGHEFYSNYDAAYPYFGEESTNIFDSSADRTGRISSGLDGSYGGNIITMVPNVDQTLMIMPLGGSNTDWRMKLLSTGDTGKTYFAIRPRYLHLPG